jgi:muramidase (phage lysozyme)
MARLTIRECVEALALRNVNAFLDGVIRPGESSRDEKAYYMRWPGLGKPVAYFTSLDAHPRMFEPTTGGRVSSAAGAFQITASTYDDFAPELGITDFSILSQRILAVAIIGAEGALADIIVGNIRAAIHKLRGRWTSLPGAEENNGRWDMDAALQSFAAAGGSFSGSDREDDAIVVPPTPSPAPAPSRPYNPDQDDPMPIPAAVLSIGAALLPTLLEAFSSVGKAKITKEMNRHLDDPVASAALADAIVGAAVKATKTVNPVVAVAEVATDPAVAQQVEEDVLADLERLAPLFDKVAAHDLKVWEAEDQGRDRAATRATQSPADDWMAKALVIGVLFISGLLIIFVGAVAAVQIGFLQTRSPTTEVWAALTGIIGTVLGILGSVFAFRFGTTRNNSIKDVTMEQLSRRK